MSEEAIRLYLAFVEVTITTSVPFMLILTVFAWSLALRAWRNGDRADVFVALGCTATGAAASWFAFAARWFTLTGSTPMEFLPLNATAILILCIAPWGVVVYEMFKEVRRKLGLHPRRRHTDGHPDV